MSAAGDGLEKLWEPYMSDGIILHTEFRYINRGRPVPCKVNGKEVMVVKFRCFSTNRVELILEDGSSMVTVPSHIIVNNQGETDE